MRRTFRDMVTKKDRIDVRMITTVNTLESALDGNGVRVNGERFDWTVNFAYFTSFARTSVTEFKVYYQPCVLLFYDDISREEPFTLTIMDGWFPNLFPILDKDCRTEKNFTRYMLYHAKYTLLGSYARHKDCLRHVNAEGDAFVQKEVRSKMEKHMNEFLYGFGERLEYVGFHVETVTN